MIIPLFSHPVWKKRLNLDEKVKSTLLTQIESNYLKFPDYVHPKWNCNVHTSCYEHNQIDYTEIRNDFVREYNEFSTHHELKLHSYKLDGPWYNYYTRGSNQEVHTHCNESVIYSGVYFLKLNDDHPKLTFYNPSSSFLYYESQRSILELYDTKNVHHTNTLLTFDLDVNEDDFILFPAYLSHGVYIQNTDEPRITISFNIVIDKQR